MRRSFWSVLRPMALVAAGLHGAFVLLFASMGLQWLAAVNVGSVLLLLGSRWLLGRRHNVAGIYTLLFEVLAHAGLAVLLLGGDSGFPYYLLALVTPIAIILKTTYARRFGLLMLVGAYFAALDLLPRLVPPVYALPPFDLAVLRNFNIAALFGCMAFFALNYAKLIQQAETTLHAMATTDPLTGLHNRRELLDIARRAPLLEADGSTVQCVLLCDIDHFKAINDSHGHDAGDRALCAVASVLKSSLRENDAVARWGGEEFLVLLRHADMGAACIAAERLRRAVAAAVVPLLPTRAAVGADGSSARAGDANVRLTITIGAARVRPGEPVSAAIARADAALYRGKAAGRNRVEPESAVEAEPEVEMKAAPTGAAQDAVVNAGAVATTSAPAAALSPH